MRELIIASASRETVTSPFSTWATNSFTRSRPRCCDEGSCAEPALLDNLIQQARLDGGGAKTRILRVAAHFDSLLLRPCLLSAVFGSAHFCAQFVELLGIGNGIHQHLVQLLVGLQRAAQIAQLAAQFQQFTQWPDLPRHLLRLKIFQAAEVQVDLQIAGIRVFAQLVFNTEGEVRTHALQHTIKVIRIDVDKATILQTRQAVPSAVR